MGKAGCDKMGKAGCDKMKAMMAAQAQQADADGND